MDFDIEQIRLVFTNLVTNASEAMDEKGLIHISALNVDSENGNPIDLIQPQRHRCDHFGRVAFHLESEPLLESGPGLPQRLCQS